MRGLSCCALSSVDATDCRYCDDMRYRYLYSTVISTTYQECSCHLQATLSLSRLSHERPEYLWLVLYKPQGDRPVTSTEPCGELSVRLQWAPAPLRKADAVEGIGYASCIHTSDFTSMQWPHMQSLCESLSASAVLSLYF